MSQVILKKILLGTSFVSFIGVTSVALASEKQEGPYSDLTSALDRKVATFTSDVASLQQQLVARAGEREYKQWSENSAVKEENGGLQSQLAQLRDAHGTLSGQHEELLGQHSSLTAAKAEEAAAAKAQIEELRAQAAATHKMIKTYVDGREAVEAELAKTKEANQGLQARVAGIDEEKRAMEQERAGYKAGQQAMSAKLEEASNRNIAIAAQLEELLPLKDEVALLRAQAAKFEAIKRAFNCSEIYLGQDGKYKGDIAGLIEAIKAAINGKQEAPAAAEHGEDRVEDVLEDVPVQSEKKQ
jgi:chromosome segregation ATPase